MTTEIKITQEDINLAKERLSQPEIFFKKICPNAKEFGKLVALKLENTKVQYPVDLLQIIVNLLKQLKKEKLQSSAKIKKSIWQLSGREIVLFVLPNFALMCEEAFPKEFAGKVIAMLAETIRPNKIDYRMN